MFVEHDIFIIHYTLIYFLLEIKILSIHQDALTSVIHIHLLVKIGDTRGEKKGFLLLIPLISLLPHVL